MTAIGSPDAKDGAGATPLIHAVEKGHDGCATALLKAGADLGARDRVGRTALARATQKGDLARCKDGRASRVESMGRARWRHRREDTHFDAGAPAGPPTAPPPCNPHHRTHARVSTRRLLAAGSEVDAVDFRGRTPLWLTLTARGEKCASQAEVATLLLLRGANVNHRDARGRTLAIFGAAKEDPEVRAPRRGREEGRGRAAAAFARRGGTRRARRAGAPSYIVCWFARISASVVAAAVRSVPGSRGARARVRSLVWRARSGLARALWRRRWW